MTFKYGLGGRLATLLPPLLSPLAGGAIKYPTRFLRFLMGRVSYCKDDDVQNPGMYHTGLLMYAR